MVKVTNLTSLIVCGLGYFIVKMDFRELIKRNDLSKSCRACLGIDENMTLLVSTDEISIFDMFVTATDLQVCIAFFTSFRYFTG